MAGAFYGYELILGSYAVPALAPVAAAALAGTMMDRALVHPESLFVVQEIFDFNPWVYLLFVLLGVLSRGLQHPHHAVGDVGRARRCAGCR